MHAVVWKSRALAVAVIFAAAGFCLAVSTVERSGPSALPYSVGTTQTLRFTNPHVALAPSEFDLGDAGFGSTLTRYVTAEGGLKPYRFTSDEPLSLSDVTAGFPTTLQLGLSGILAGSLPPRPRDATTKVLLAFPSKTVTGSDGFRFQVTVKDAKAFAAVPNASVTGIFNLQLVDTTVVPFRFAMDSLPEARLGASYLVNLDVVGGRGGVTYSVLSAVDTATGLQVFMDDLGLFISADGSVFGRPLIAGVFALKVRCVDSRLAIALSRNGLVQDQVFNLVVRDQPVTSTDLAAVKLLVRGDLDKVSTDVLQYQGLVSTLGRTAASLLNSDFSFRLGGIFFSGRLNSKGQYAATLDDGSKVSFKVNTAQGLVDVAIKKGSFADALEAFDLVRGLNRRAVEVTIGDAVGSSEVLDLATSLTGSHYSLSYRLGSGPAGSSAAGVFQVTSVLGKDGTTKSGTVGDSWQVRFLAVPRKDVIDPLGRSQGFSGVSGATVRIGANFTQAITGAPLLVKRGDIRFKGAAGDGVKSLTFSTSRFTGKLQTSLIATGSTGIPLASQAPQFSQVFFSLGLDLDRGAAGAPFSGEHARAIFGLKRQYKDTPPRR